MFCLKELDFKDLFKVL